MAFSWLTELAVVASMKAARASTVPRAHCLAHAARAVTQGPALWNSRYRPDRARSTAPYSTIKGPPPQNAAVGLAARSPQ